MVQHTPIGYSTQLVLFTALLVLPTTSGNPSLDYCIQHSVPGAVFTALLVLVLHEPFLQLTYACRAYAS